ncbi:hypothetical protein BDF21DRAFT_402350 [Thamnidium elegans]|nr:hypothetical protein BDF21DRAFT_402350 [Thamnidium elegans]
MLRKEGFQVYLLDEYKASSICPSCEHQLQNFKECINPRPYRRSKNPIVKYHGLLSLYITCVNVLDAKTGPKTLAEEDTKFRLWNRDLGAVLNFRKNLNPVTVGKKPLVNVR